MNTTFETHSIIAGQWFEGSGNNFESWDPNLNKAIATVNSCTCKDVNAALSAAVEAKTLLDTKTSEEIAGFLLTLADEIEALKDTFIPVAMAETGLPESRLQGETGRTCGQIRAFAALVAEGSWRQASIDTADANRQPVPKPDVRAMNISLGPIAIFGASNFPFAFGTLGGDSAAALAAGNPIIVKGHPSHPLTSRYFAQAMVSALEKTGFPIGTFSLLQGCGTELGSELVKHSDIKAVGFTGSLGGGRALMDIAAKRAEPIPVYAEMGSINPVFIMPEALDSRADAIAQGLASSIAMGCGQFCTSPGLIVCLKSELPKQLAHYLSEQTPGVMLNPGIADAMQSALASRLNNSQIAFLTGGLSDTPLTPQASLMQINAADFLASGQSIAEFSEEIFGPASLVVSCESTEQMLAVAKSLSGNLTATIHADDYQSPSLSALLNLLKPRTGRILFNNYPTRVEVCQSMQHGGPYPASSFAHATSVGTAAISRFISRNAYQNWPDELLPVELQNGNPMGILRMVDGHYSRTAITIERA